MDGYAEGDYPPLSANVVLAPWPNRVRDGRFHSHGHTYQLTMTEPSRNNAIHGFVANTVWQITPADHHDANPSAVTLTTTVEPREGWPWTLDITSTYELSDVGLTCTCAITNVSDHYPHRASAVNNDKHCRLAPVAYGFHSYLNALGSPLNECILDIPVHSHLLLDPVRKLPTGTIIDARHTLGPAITTDDVPTDTYPMGSNQGAPVHRIHLRDQLFDDCFRINPRAESHTGLIRAARLLNTAGQGTELWTSPRMRWLQIFTADPTWGHTYPSRGRAIAVEPMTAPPDALNSGTDIEEIAPGESFTVQWRIAYSSGRGG